MRTPYHIEPPTRPERRRRFAQIDGALNGGRLTAKELRALKDELLAMIAADKSASFDAGARLARINGQIRALLDQADLAAPEGCEERFREAFFAAAKRLLEPAVFEMLCRDARSRREEIRASQPVKEIPLPPPVQPPSPPPPKPVAPPPMGTPLHRLVSKATNRPMKFDPTPLFKEFGRERVLATWNMCPPEERPETGAAFRKILLASAVQSFLKQSQG